MWQDYNEAQAGQDGVLVKNDCTSTFDVASLGNIWSTVNPEGPDLANIAAHHSSEGFTPNNGSEAGYKLLGLDSTIGATLQQGGQISVKMSSNYLVDGTTRINEVSNGSALETADQADTSDAGTAGRVYDPSSNNAILSCNSGCSMMLAAKQTGGQVQTRWITGETHYDFGDLTADNQISSSPRFNGVNKVPTNANTFSTDSNYL